MKLLRFPPGLAPRTSEAGASEDLVSRLLLENLSALYSLAYRLCGERSLAEDFVQETARKALGGASVLRHRQHLRAWLFKILTNVARDHLRHGDRWEEKDLVDEDLACTSANSVLSDATTHDVRKALGQLTIIHRAIILLVDMEDFTLAEAAEILQIPLGTAASRLARARKELQQRLAAYRSEQVRSKGTLMNCPETRFILYPSPEKCALTLETSKALEHLHECVKCQEHFTAQVEWSRILKEKMGNDEVPEQLQTRIMEEVGRRPNSKPVRRLGQVRRWMLLTAALIFCLVGAWLSYWWPSRQLFRTVFEDHARYQQAQSQVNSSSAEELESWFRDKTDFGVRIPTLDSAQLVGGRLCFLKGRKAALVFYRKDGRTVSLFQLNGRGISLAALKQAEPDGSALGRMSFKGYSLAAFEQRGVVYVVVSDLRESELLNLASSMQMKSRGY